MKLETIAQKHIEDKHTATDIIHKYQGKKSISDHMIGRLLEEYILTKHSFFEKSLDHLRLMSRRQYIGSDTAYLDRLIYIDRLFSGTGVFEYDE